MGLLSSRRSVTNVTDVTNVSQGFEDIQGPAIGGDNNVVSIQLEDHGAVDRAFELGSRNLDLTRDVVRFGIDAAREANSQGIEAVLRATGDGTAAVERLAGRSLDFGETLLARTQAQIGSTVEAFNNIFRQSSTSGDERVERVSRTALIIAGLMVGAYIVAQVWKK